MNEYSKISPHNIEAEQSVLGSMIIDRLAVERCVPLLVEEDFYVEGHRIIYRAMCDLFRNREPVDLVMVQDKLQAWSVLDRIGGMSYLARLADVVPTTANAEYYASIVADKAMLRNVIDRAKGLIEAAFSGTESPQMLMQEMVDFGRNQRETHYDIGWSSVSDISDETINYIIDRSNNRGKLSGIPSGFTDIDRHTDGYERGMLSIVAARPSMGKTTYLLNVARNAAIEGFGVGIFPLEESSLQEGIRLASQSSGLSMFNLRRGFLESGELDSLRQHMGSLRGLPIYFNKDHSVNLQRLVSRVHSLKSRHNIDMLIIDHAGEIDTSDVNGNVVKQIGAVATVCKRIARTYDIAVLLASQLSRAVESRDDKHPIMSDLRDSGELEQKADLIQFLYRPAYYYKTLEQWSAHCQKQRESPTPYPANVVEVITAKGRNVGQDTAYIHFDEDTNRMRAMTDDEIRVATTPIKQLQAMMSKEVDDRTAALELLEEFGGESID